MTGQLCSFVFSVRRKDWKTIMKKINAQNAVCIPLFSDREKPQDFDVYVFGSNKPSDKEKDTLRNALKRYLTDYNVSPSQLAELTGISRTSIYYYLSDTRQISYRYLCAICIALRLHPTRQRHLFSLAGYLMPDERGNTRQSDYILRNHLDACAFIESFSLATCNDRLKAIGERPITKLIFQKEDKQ